VDGHLPQLQELLALPELAKGDPLVVAGEGRLSVRVRWVHVSELPDIAEHLDGGELILTTGIGLSSEPSELQRYIDDLASTASGLAVELGRRFDELPPVFVERAERRGLPLIALRREVAFVRVTEEVHRLIVDAHVRQLQASSQAHATFTALSVEGASPDVIVARLVEMTGRSAVLENLTRQVVSVAVASGDERELLEGWERRSRLMGSQERTSAVSDDPPWLATVVAARGEQWGRLLLQSEPTTTNRMMLEQAATAIALNRLVERDRGTLERSAHGSLLAKIAGRTYSSTAEVLVRATALGVPLADRLLVGACVRVHRRDPGDGIEQHARQRDDAERVARAASELGMPGLISALESDGVGVLLSFGARSEVQAGLERLSGTIHRSFSRAEPGVSVVVAVGTPVEQVADVRRSLREAIHISQAAPSVGEEKSYYQLEDVRVRGLLHLLREDTRLQTFVERQLAALLEHDERHGTTFLQVLSAFLHQSGNKSAAAEEAGLSRPAFYQRLERISQILGVDLESAEVRLSLHLALTALDVMRSGEPGSIDEWSRQ
jgi:PucR family transcriptional regulator, purine catabolism regulatory protein